MDLVVGALVAASWPPLFSVCAGLRIYKVIRLRSKKMIEETEVTTVSRNVLVRTPLTSV